MSEVIERTEREAKRLIESLKSLDFELQQFNNFVHTVKGFKLRGFLWSMFMGLCMGLLVSILVVIPFLKGMSNGPSLPDGVTVFEDNEVIQLYTDRKSTVFTDKNTNLNVLQIYK